MQAGNSSVRFAGDVSVNSIKITTRNGVSQEISAQVIAISIYEDLFAPFMTGSVILKESFDFINHLPFVGEEYIELDISTPTLASGNFKSKFYVYKLTDRELVGDRSVSYQLHFISIEAIVDLNKKVSKVFTGTPEELVRTLLTDKVNGLETKKNYHSEASTKETKFISNFWSPTKAISHLAGLSVNSNGSPSYVFFENRDGFYFVSLDSLYAKNVYQEFTYDRYTRTPLSDGTDIKDVQEDYRRINQISIPTGFDYMDRLRSGMFASKMISYDMNKKSYLVKNYAAETDFSKRNHLNQHSMLGSNAIFRSNAALLTLPRDNANFSGFGDATNYKTIQERASVLKMAEANKIEIVVPGRADYTVGQKVSVTLNKVEVSSKKDTDNIDKMFSGFYLIGAINHYITRERHECNIELIKDTLQLNINGA